ncbi:ubiquitin-protein ligase [Lithospermum erythrorhizon]|uniref:RING-type E3 ubiquitin transferase n=1 Tax=Lithospermum erythrorhizon TaxID=34254 RepID=A0AAV3P558_LITER
MAGNFADGSFFEQMMNDSRNRAIPLFLPFVLGIPSFQNNSNPIQDFSNQNEQPQNSDNLVLVNPFTQSMVVLQSSRSTNLESFFRDLFVTKDGQPPASKASIEAMQCVEVSEDNCDGECVVCLEDWEVGQVAKEMPCKHRFHGDCIEKWLKIHGSCPVCRFNMPVEEDQDVNKKNESENRGRGRGVWVSFSIGSDRRSQNSGDSQRGLNDSSDS